MSQLTRLMRLSQEPYAVRAAAALGSGFIGSCTLAVLAEAVLGASEAEPGYPLSAIFTQGFLIIFVIGGGLLGLVTGRLTQCCFPFAIGMILPLPIALAIEVSLDPTSHNLFPFEVVLVWVPAFAVTYGAAWSGGSISGEAPTPR